MSAVDSQAQSATKPQRDRQFNGFISKLTAKNCVIRCNAGCRLSDTHHYETGCRLSNAETGCRLSNAQRYTKPAAC